MKFAILVCITTLIVGNFAISPCLNPPQVILGLLPDITGLISTISNLLTSDLACLTNCTSALSNDPCYGTIAGQVSSLVPGLVTGLLAALGGLLGTLGGQIPSNTTSGINLLNGYVCQLAKSIPAGSIYIPPGLCCLLNCLLKIVLDLLSALISLIAGILSLPILGAIANLVLKNNLTLTLTTLVGQLTQFVGCLVTLATVTCLHDTLCNVKSTVGCIVGQLTAVGINASALNAAVANIAPLKCP